MWYTSETTVLGTEPQSGGEHPQNTFMVFSSWQFMAIHLSIITINTAYLVPTLSM